jgi:5-methylcytosine-specific restriction enzyme A
MDKQKLKVLFSKNGFLLEKEVDLLRAVYSFPEHSARASDVYKLLGYTGYPPVNKLVGTFGKKIADNLSIPLSERYDGTYRGWDVIFNGKQVCNGGWLWIMKPEVIQVIEELNIVDSVYSSSEEVHLESGHFCEGSVKTIQVNSYERNQFARSLCIKHFGCKCYICKFDFHERYGSLGKDFIEVHHVIPLSQLNGEYSIDPIQDLRPLCSNCHSMIHRRKDSTLSIDELIGVMKSTESFNKQ